MSKPTSVTVTWSITIPVNETFNRDDPSDRELAIKAAWSQLSESDGEITDVETED